MKLIPFDLEKALAGAEVRMRDGSKVTGVGVYGNYGGDYPVFANENLRYTMDGKWYSDGTDSEFDIFLVAPKPKPRKTHFSCGTPEWNKNYFYREATK